MHAVRKNPHCMQWGKTLTTQSEGITSQHSCSPVKQWQQWGIKALTSPGVLSVLVTELLCLPAHTTKPLTFSCTENRCEEKIPCKCLTLQSVRINLCTIIVSLDESGILCICHCYAAAAEISCVCSTVCSSHPNFFKFRSHVSCTKF